jgi:hypothetical protein
MEMKGAEEMPDILNKDAEVEARVKTRKGVGYGIIQKGQEK